jgi:diguanylate cyclase (GGDEF)-like protein
MLSSLLLLLFSFISNANTIEVNETFNTQKVTSLRYSFLPTSIEQAQQLTDSQWKKITTAPLNLGLVQTPVWIKFNITNTDAMTFNSFLSIENPLIEQVQIYHFQQQQLMSSATIGDSLPISSRQIKSESFVIKLALQANSQNTIFVRVQNKAGVRVPMQLWQQDAYLNHRNKVNLIKGLLIGFMLSMAVTHLILYGFSRKKYFAYAGILTLILWCSLIYILGFGFLYFHPNLPSLQQVIIPILMMLTALLFSPLEKLICRPKNETWIKPKKILSQLFSVMILFIWVLPINIISIVALIATPIIVLSNLITTLMCIKEQANSPAKAFFIALCCYFVVLIYLNIVVFGLYGFERATIAFVFICFLSIATCLSYAVMKLFVLQRDEQVTAQQAVIAESAAKDTLLKERLELQEEIREELESQVDERTFELQVTLRELEEKNQALEQLNTEDALTGVKNRRFFDKKLVMELRRSRREQAPLSVVMLDIDHFKNINDTYGHLAGDYVIRDVANIIQNLIRRPLDEVARYGGEEFVLLLPNTSETGAIDIADKIRKAISQSGVQSAGSHLKYTISAGVYTSIANDINHPEYFTDNADKALYHAKQNGRNQVASFPIK